MNIEQREPLSEEAIAKLSSEVKEIVEKTFNSMLAVDICLHGLDLLNELEEKYDELKEKDGKFSASAAGVMAEAFEKQVTTYSEYLSRNRIDCSVTEKGGLKPN